MALLALLNTSLPLLLWNTNHTIAVLNVGLLNTFLPLLLWNTKHTIVVLNVALLNTPLPLVIWSINHSIAVRIVAANPFRSCYCGFTRHMVPLLMCLQGKVQTSEYGVSDGRKFQRQHGDSSCTSETVN